MEEEKTLLQQIRDKEQAFSKKIEAIKQETDEQIAAAEREREITLRQAEATGKKSAEELFRREQQETEIELGRMKEAAEFETETAIVKGTGNLQPAIEKIIGYVTLE
jgi:vacuolar-type H+-ATPase subunit H